MNGVCSKCSGEGHVMVQGEDVHWHWEACPDCNGFEEMALAANVTFDSWGDRSGSEGRRMSEPRRNCRSCYYRNTTWIGSVEASASCDHPDFLPEGRGLTLTEFQAPEWCPLGVIQPLRRDTLIDLPVSPTVQENPSLKHALLDWATRGNTTHRDTPSDLERGLTLTEVQAPEWCPLGAPSSAEEDAGADERRKLNDDLNDDLPW